MTRSRCVPAPGRRASVLAHAEYPVPASVIEFLGSCHLTSEPARQLLVERSGCALKRQEDAMLEENLAKGAARRAGTVYLVGAGPGDPGLLTCGTPRPCQQATSVARSPGQSRILAEATAACTGNSVASRAWSADDQRPSSATHRVRKGWLRVCA